MYIHKYMVISGLNRGLAGDWARLEFAMLVNLWLGMRTNPCGCRSLNFRV